MRLTIVAPEALNELPNELLAIIETSVLKLNLDTVLTSLDVDMLVVLSTTENKDMRTTYWLRAYYSSGNKVTGAYLAERYYSSVIRQCFSGSGAIFEVLLGFKAILSDLMAFYFHQKAVMPLVFERDKEGNKILPDTRPMEVRLEEHLRAYSFPQVMGAATLCKKEGANFSEFLPITYPSFTDGEWQIPEWLNM